MTILKGTEKAFNKIHSFMIKKHCQQIGYTRNIPQYMTKCVATLSCLTLCDPMDCSPPGSAVHGILQARILEWVDISYSS